MFDNDGVEALLEVPKADDVVAELGHVGEVMLLQGEKHVRFRLWIFLLVDIGVELAEDDVVDEGLDDAILAEERKELAEVEIGKEPGHASTVVPSLGGGPLERLFLDHALTTELR